ncbi:MAG: Unknown protein [uncultured Sulfurovum sp.]|uniref:Uncharacterized protein n=1 Tax=uncultured Sulfurovum sp. TaxID=269237 RepID=A0A6S6SWI8_9BACT|nr:MAG: Unknown protein [uncultured Sulfurovum sp.]
MAITGLTTPHTYSSAYSYMPVRFVSDNVNTLTNFDYLVNITYDRVGVSSSLVVGIGGTIGTQLTLTQTHNFEIGDKVLLDDASDDYTGIYTVLDIVSTTVVIINLKETSPMIGPSTLSKTIPYKNLPDLDKESKITIHNSIKDFVTQNLEDVNEIFEGPDTVFDYDIQLGEQYTYHYPFVDNYAGSTGVGFNNTGLTAADLAFKVGDRVEIVQDITEWKFQSTFLPSGSINQLGLIGTTQNDFGIGIPVTVTGQIAEPSYNGSTVVADLVNSTRITVAKQWITDTTDAGSIFGYPRPTYNTIATITDIYDTVGFGVVVETDITWAGSSLPIGGKMYYADGRTTKDITVTGVTGMSAYNSYTDLIGYTADAMDKYVIQNRTANNNYSSTILSDDLTTEYRIEKESKSWLLQHMYITGITTQGRFEYFDASGNSISTVVINNVTTNDKDFYVPVGIDQVINSSNTFLFAGSPLSTVRDDVDKYTFAMYTMPTRISNEITFNVNDDCTSYEMLHLMWKDKLGSWLSYPFKYMSKDRTAFDRATFYQTNGKWDRGANTFGYDTFGRGEKSYFNQSRDSITLNSGWANEGENRLIKDLLDSASVYVQLEDGTLVGCILNDTDFTFSKKDNEMIYQYELDITLSNNAQRY